MNKFTNLSAESEISALALVSTSEVFTESDAQESPRYGVNAAKLVRHNLSKPIESRISFAELSAKVSFAKTRGNIVGLWATIHAECENKKKELWAKEEILSAL
jgi:hypothetical protein